MGASGPPLVEFVAVVVDPSSVASACLSSGFSWETVLKATVSGDVPSCGLLGVEFCCGRRFTSLGKEVDAVLVGEYVVDTGLSC